MPQLLKTGTSSQTTFIEPSAREGEGVFVISPELETRVGYLALQRDWVVAEQFQADFNLNFYNLETTREEIEEHVGAFLGEKLLAPRSQSLWIGRNGTLDPDYIVMMERSIEYWRQRGDTKAVQRFESELTGMRNLTYLVMEQGLAGEEIPVVIMASDPGEFYMDKLGRKKSATFVGLLEQSEANGWRYRILSLPTKFIGLTKHKELLWRIGDIEKTKRILGSSLENLTADNLVAFPVLLDHLVRSLDELAADLGFPSWNRIEELAADQLALENDIYARSRRAAMVDEFTRQIWALVQNGRSFDEKEAMVSAMSEMFALETGKEYLGWNEEKIQSEIKKNIKLALAQKLGALENEDVFIRYAEQYDLGGWQDAVGQYGWMQNAFMTNPLAQEALSTGCGGSGNNYQQGLGWDKFSFGHEQPTYSGFDMINSFGYTSTDTDSVSTGKYKEYYDYKPGVCAHCHEHKSYVAYPKSSDVKCAGWCSDCEK
ncbi:MAG: hypothetical protein UX37_C0001G0001 [Microgenomates group bacterium GW2011_GWA2_46_16]|nr:MAG: hypothetical protein UX37_C0001G0001 [Microgenomates group bacterium GW2011_GWA2_46_16]